MRALLLPAALSIAGSLASCGDNCVSICHDDHESCLEDCLEDLDCGDECDGAESDCLTTCDD